MTATAAENSIGVAPELLEELDDANGSLTGITPATLDRIEEVQDLIQQGESEANIARFIAAHPDFTDAEKLVARIVLRRHGMRILPHPSAATA